METRERESIIIDREGKLGKLHHICLNNKIPFVSYRLPYEKIPHTLLQTRGLPQKIGPLNELAGASGFVITPFVANRGLSSYLLQPDITIHDEEVSDETFKQLSELNLSGRYPSLNGHGALSVSRNGFIQQVNAFKSAIDKGIIDKAVLSRIYIENRDNEFDLSRFFHELCNTYNYAFVYLLQLPGVGCWAGASPEPLLTISGNTVETISLAGTLKAVGAPDGEISWKTKELIEQHIVTKHIENTLHAFNISRYNKTGPFNFNAGQVVHLKTRFTFDVNTLGNKLWDFVAALHPSPSVSGFPKENAIDLIQKTELHQREYYSGLLGPVNIDNKTGLYVNIRSMKIYEEKLALYLGAGIISGSDAESEWDETNQKRMTLLSVINKLKKGM